MNWERNLANQNSVWDKGVYNGVCSNIRHSGIEWPNSAPWGSKLLLLLFV